MSEPHPPDAPAAPDGPAPAPWRRAWWLLGAFALALRLFDLGRHELWIDEGITYFFARLLGNLQLGEEIWLEPTPPLYYALVGLLMRLFGDSDLVMRLPSALFGAISAPLVALLGERLGWRRAGFFGGALLALHPLHLALSREARVYPLLLMLVLLLAIALWRALEPGAAPRSWLAVAGLLALCLWSHLFGIFVGAAAAFVVLVLATDGRSRRLGLAAVAGAFLIFAPYLAMALPVLEDSGASWTQETFYRHFPAEGGLPRIYEGQLIGARYNALQRHLALPETPPLLRWPPILAQSLLLLASLLLAFGGEPEGKRRADRRALFFVFSFYLLPFVLPWAAGMIRGKVFLQAGRHDFLVLGPLCLLLGAGFEALRRRSNAAWLVVLPIAADALFRLAWLHVLPSATEATQRGSFLAAAAGPGDLAVGFHLERLLGERYTRLAGGALPFRSFPGETDRHPGYSDPRTFAGRLPELQTEARKLIAERAGQGRLLLLDRMLPDGSAERVAGQEADDILIAALREAGWRLEENRGDLRIQIWSPP